jgi:AraC-like DNA-binding protein
VAKLALIAGVSQRSLEHAFQDRFDLGPKRYLTARRMFGVRRALRRAASEPRVQDVARRWGFRHLGQFAVDYRSWFHERSSETLR